MTAREFEKFVTSNDEIEIEISKGRYYANKLKISFFQLLDIFDNYFFKLSDINKLKVA